MNKKSLFIGVIAVFALTFVAAVTLFNSDKATKETAFVNKNASSLERASAPFKGARDAKVTIVEFFDPACGTCKNFYPMVNDLIKKYPGKVKLMMRYAPLHQGSDQVVKLLEAANMQGQFWPALETLYANQNSWVTNHVSQPNRARVVIRGLGLNSEKFSADLRSIELVKAINQDITDGKNLNVSATPEFFVNGKPMPSFGYQQLTDLVEEAIAQQY